MHVQRGNPMSNSCSTCINQRTQISPMWRNTSSTFFLQKDIKNYQINLFSNDFKLCVFFVLKNIVKQFLNNFFKDVDSSR